MEMVPRRSRLITPGATYNKPCSRSASQSISQWVLEPLEAQGDFTGRTALQNPTTTPQYPTAAEPIPTMDHQGTAYRY